MKLAAIVLSGLLAGCAYRPIVDARDGVDPERYRKDLAECEQYAAQVGSPADHALVGAVAGGILGGVIGAIFCGRSCAGQLAGGTAVMGAAHSAKAGANTQANVLRRCLSGRGYYVLN